MPAKRLLRAVKDPRRRAVLVLYGGALFHFLYALFRLMGGVVYRRSLLDAVAVYYLLLALNRLLLILYHRRGEGERRAARLSGLLLFVTVALLLILIAQTVSGERRPSTPPLFTVASGIYALLCAALALYELLWADRLACPVLVASRTVSLAAVLLSGFTFLSELLFSLPVGEHARGVVLISVGAAAILLLLLLSVLLYRKQKIK
ncbi:MAG: hypothetical protein IJV96_04680 [Clostridia bacterium]|nr:hypothetical protein [Clostridia bacterium]